MSLSFLTHYLLRPLRPNGCSFSGLPKLIKTYSSGPSPSSSSLLTAALRRSEHVASKSTPRLKHSLIRSLAHQSQPPAATVQMRPFLRRLGFQSPIPLLQTPLRSFRGAGGGGVLMTRSGSVQQLLPIRIAGLATMSEGVLQRLQNQVCLTRIINSVRR